MSTPENLMKAMDLFSLENRVHSYKFKHYIGGFMCPENHNYWTLLKNSKTKEIQILSSRHSYSNLLYYSNSFSPLVFEPQIDLKLSEEKCRKRLLRSGKLAQQKGYADKKQE